jgi:uncharacterized protein YbcI
MAETLGGGQLLAAISTAIVGIVRDHYGRGPMKAKTYAFDDVITCVMRETGFTPLEKTIMDSGEPDTVIELRRDFQHIVGARYKEAIEALTGRKVLACLTEVSLEPDVTVAMFFVDTPLEGFDTSDPEVGRLTHGLMDRRLTAGDRRSDPRPRRDQDR